MKLSQGTLTGILLSLLAVAFFSCEKTEDQGIQLKKMENVNV